MCTWFDVLYCPEAQKMLNIHYGLKGEEQPMCKVRYGKQLDKSRGFGYYYVSFGAIVLSLAVCDHYLCNNRYRYRLSLEYHKPCCAYPAVKFED